MFVNHKYKFIFKCIPKVASRSLRLWFLRSIDFAQELNIRNEAVKKWLECGGECKTKSPIGSGGWQQDSKVFCKLKYARSSEYFKFIVMRDPFARLVSAYVTRMRSRKSPISKIVVEETYKEKRLPVNMRKGITFREFVEYMVKREDNEINAHFRSQSSFINMKFDFVAKLENIESDFVRIQQAIGLYEPLPKVGSILHASVGQYPDAADMSMSKIRRLKPKPHYSDFYPPGLTELVSKRYKKDIDYLSEDYNC